MNSLLAKNNCLTRKRQFVNEINVTPMVDIMLVLLIVFMVTTPVLITGINIELPETHSSPIDNQSQPLIVTIDKNNKLYIIDTQIDMQELVTTLERFTKKKKSMRIFVQGDKSISYGLVVDTMSRIHKAGFTQVALISTIKNK